MTAYVNTLRATGGHYSSIQDWVDDLDNANVDWDAHDLYVLTYTNYVDISAGGVTHPEVGWAIIGSTSNAIAHILTEPREDGTVLVAVTSGTFNADEACTIFAVNDTLDIVGSLDPCDETVLECYNDTYAGPDGAYNLTTNVPETVGKEATRLTIRAAAGEGCDGVFDAGFKVAVDQVGQGHGIQLNGACYVSLENLQLQTQRNSKAALIFFACVGVRVSRCLFPGYPQTSCVDQNTHATPVTYGNIEIDRCIVKDSTWVAGYKLPRGTIARSCGVYGSVTGFAGNQKRIINCVSFGNTTDWSGGNDEAESSNNAGGNGTAPGSSGINTLTASDFADYANGDYTPAASGSLLDGAGVDLGAEFTTDIKGNTYSDWDIGPLANAPAASDLTFDGPDIANQSVVGGQPLSTSVAGKWSSSNGPITYSASPDGTAWPTWLSVNTSTGEISGTPDGGASQLGTTADLKVRGTDADNAFVDSNAFSVEVTLPAGPVFDPALPADVTAAVGNLVSLAVSVTGEPAIAVVWQKKESGDVDFANIEPPNTDNPYEFTATANDDGDEYRVLYWDIWNNLGYSRAASITISAGAPSLDPTLPQDTTALETTSPVLSVSASGGAAPYAYQWYEVGVGAMGGETGSSLTLSSVTYASDDGRQFYCEVTDDNSVKVTSRTAALDVPAPLVSDPALPADTTANDGHEVTLTASITKADGGGVLVGWEVNTGSGWESVPGAPLGSTLTITPSLADHGNQYRAGGLDAYGQGLYSRAATLSVNVYGSLEAGEQTTEADYEVFGFVLGTPPSAVQVAIDASSQVAEEEAVPLTQQHNLAVEDLLELQEATQSTLGLLAIQPDPATGGQILEAPSVWIELVQPDSAEQAESLGQGGILTSEIPLVLPANLELAQEFEQAVFTQTYLVYVDGTAQAQIQSTTELLQAQLIEVHEAAQLAYDDYVGLAVIIGIKLEGDIITYAALSGDLITY